MGEGTGTFMGREKAIMWGVGGGRGGVLKLMFFFGIP